MDQALRLAARGLGRTRPNPVVGCVLVRDGQRVGWGYHHRAGLPHAEIEALNLAGTRAQGATAYVTLEPCCHHGRTPPCSQALIQAGVQRVVVAMRDPNPKVDGGGVAQLRSAGISVDVDLLSERAQALNAPFVSWVMRQRPLVTLKTAASLDGKIATRTGQSQWITSPEARRKGHRLRDIHDVILVGIGTVLADDPRLTCRLRGGRSPIRVVVDSALRIPEDAALFTDAEETPLWIATTDRANLEKQRRLAERPGVEMMTLPRDGNDRVSLPDLLRTLAQRDVTSVLSEAGGKLSHALLSLKLADRMALFSAHKLIGGHDAPGFLDGWGVDQLKDTPFLRRVHTQSVGPDVLVQGDLHYTE